MKLLHSYTYLKRRLPEENLKPSDDDPQVQDMAVTWTVVVKDSKNDFLSPAKYSSLTKLLKVTAYALVLCWLKRWSRLESFGSALPQAESFPQEVTVLKSKQHVSSKCKLVSLSPFLDAYRIIRAGGQIERADIPFCSRHPLVLAHYHELTHLIIMNCHEKLNI